MANSSGLDEFLEFIKRSDSPGVHVGWLIGPHGSAKSRRILPLIHQQEKNQNAPGGGREVFFLQPNRTIADVTKTMIDIEKPGTEQPLLRVAPEFLYENLAARGSRDLSRPHKTLIVIDNMVPARTEWDYACAMTLRRWVGSLRRERHPETTLTIVFLASEKDPAWDMMGEQDMVFRNPGPTAPNLELRHAHSRSAEPLSLEHEAKYMALKIFHMFKEHPRGAVMCVADSDMQLDVERHIYGMWAVEASQPGVPQPTRTETLWIDRDTTDEELAQWHTTYSDRGRLYMVNRVFDLRISTPPDDLYGVLLSHNATRCVFDGELGKMARATSGITHAESEQCKRWLATSKRAHEASRRTLWYIQDETRRGKEGRFPRGGECDPMVLWFLIAGLNPGASPSEFTRPGLTLSSAHVEDCVRLLKVTRALMPGNSHTPRLYAPLRIQPGHAASVFTKMLLSGSTSYATCWLRSAVDSNKDAWDQVTKLIVARMSVLLRFDPTELLILAGNTEWSPEERRGFVASVCEKCPVALRLLCKMGAPWLMLAVFELLDTDEQFAELAAARESAYTLTGQITVPGNYIGSSRRAIADTDRDADLVGPPRPPDRDLEKVYLNVTRELLKAWLHNLVWLPGNYAKDDVLYCAYDTVTGRKLHIHVRWTDDIRLSEGRYGGGASPDPPGRFAIYMQLTREGGDYFISNVVPVPSQLVYEVRSEYGINIPGDLRNEHVL
ncbi:hypothetical protein F4779DRAFT_576783 [Xylariaceae sp. FL0662B]|nr:hypothetical protein F4779DRAFT_576783 [Xylariaceae sp. FL0662B]